MSAFGEIRSLEEQTATGHIVGHLKIENRNEMNNVLFNALTHTDISIYNTQKY